MSDQAPGIGSMSDVPTPVENPSFEGLQLAPEDWFVLSRVDGAASVRDIVNLSPKGRDETIEILRRLTTHGLIELPEATSDSTQTSSKTRSKRSSLPTPPPGWPTSYDAFEPDPELMNASGPMPEDFRRLLLYYHAFMREVSYYDLLGAARDDAPSKIKRSYFRLSKTFHPDRYFRADLGPLERVLNEVFRWLNDAQKHLGNKRRRAAYDTILDSGRLGEWDESGGSASPAASSPEPSAGPPPSGRPFTELIAEAKKAERSSQFRAAVDLYEEALQQRDSAEIMNRVAECLIRLKEDLEHAERRARGAVERAPETARYHVALAFILELRSRTGDAIASYERALVLDPNHAGAKQRLARLQQGR